MAPSNFAAHVSPGVANPASIHPFNNIDSAPAGTTLVYVTDYANGVVDVYSESGKQLAQVAGFSGPRVSPRMRRVTS